jgi:D-alanyl-D-alanine carboxypeptidase (penicillin-binding protein 5/6)
MPPPTFPPRPRAAFLLLIALVAALLLAPPPATVAAPGDGNAPKPPQLDARAWILLDARDGTVLASKDETATLPIASTTKLMTAYLALDRFDGRLDKLITAPRYDALPAESVLGLQTGERMSVEDLITAMMLPSANDAAHALAEGVSGSVPAFVDEMNAAAADLGLDDTSYANPIGLDDPANGSSARDLAALTMQLQQNKRFRKIVAQPSATLETGAMPRTIETRNTLMLSDPTVDGVKTGHTLGAGYVLVASAERKGVPLISVVLGASSESGRDIATAQLLDYGTSLYAPRRALARGEELDTVPVTEGDPESLTLEAAKPFEITARADQELIVEVDGPVAVAGPIPAGERLGVATVLLDGEPVGDVPAVAAFAIAEPGWLERNGGGLAAALIVGGLILLGVAIAIALRRSNDAP